MDLSHSIEPNSEQVNAEDLLVGPRTVTITGVEAGTADQPVFIHLAEFPERTYRPAKSMRRVIAACWGPDSSLYIGRRITIYCDPTVKWGGQPVGGVRISHMSDLEKPMTVSLTVTRGKRAPFTVQPLKERDTHLDAINAASTLEELRTAWVAAEKAGHAKRLTAAKDKRKAELSKPEPMLLDESDPDYVAPSDEQ